MAANYGFDQDKIVKTVTIEIDENGFHRETVATPNDNSNDEPAQNGENDNGNNEPGQNGENENSNNEPAQNGGNEQG